MKVMEPVVLGKGEPSRLAHLRGTWKVVFNRDMPHAEVVPHDQPLPVWARGSVIPRKGPGQKKAALAILEAQGFGREAMLKLMEAQEEDPA